MQDCLFCKIIAREVPAEIVYDDETVLGILDMHPRAVGHTMILPKRHAETILDVPSGDLGAIFSAVQHMTELLKNRLHPDGFTIGVNHGKASGQAIDHLHVHIIPRFRADGGTSLHGVVRPPEDKPMPPLDEVRRSIVQQ